MVFRTTLNDTTAVYTPWNLAILSGELREARLVGNQPDAEVIYTRVFKTVYNDMMLAEAEQSGETGSDSDGDGVPYIVGGTRPFVFANKGVYQLTITGLAYLNKNLVNINIYPNPATNYVSVDVEVEHLSQVDVVIYDINGRIVASQNVGNVSGSQNIRVNLDNLNTGNYMVRVMFDSEPVSIEKLIVK